MTLLLITYNMVNYLEKIELIQCYFLRFLYSKQ